ncbi:membrane-spanning 4-domains subfamily A member 15 [Trichomycterus rosablanca]|uniref:membrane-spanning 4-domains subfamily A member 15 n=1 Tax=Trichomycterus rosablanca TaxID=2290929 RepID=UPI002F3544CC
MDTTIQSEGAEEVEETGPVTNTNSQTGGTKPLHRFLRGEPKIIGIVLLSIGLCLFMFAIPSRGGVMESSTDNYTPFWLGILYSICGILYILSERQIHKKIVTASFALSIIAILGTILGTILYIKTIITQNQMYYYGHYDLAPDGVQFLMLNSLEAVFLFHSLVAGVILIAMSVFARLALRSSHTQMFVVMRYPASTE